MAASSSATRSATRSATGGAGGDVVGFGVEELSVDVACEVGELELELELALELDLLGTFGDRGGFGLGGGSETLVPVVGALESEEGGGKEREQRAVVEALLVQVHVRWGE
jgi:hypothetical protein